MNRSELVNQIRIKNTFLCVGLDPDIEKIPKFLLNKEDPIFEFCRQIIDSTAEYCVAFKPNSAFFESHGLSGIISMDKTMRYIKQHYNNHLLIADAKRGDIGNTSSMYAKAYFKHFNADAITVSPYMGEDSIKPFLNFENKWTIVLALTSNEGSGNFQMLNSNGVELYKSVLTEAIKWGTEDNLMFVVGATKATMLKDIRKIIPNHFLLIPGLGTQGGSLNDVCEYGLNKDIGILISASRSVIYASNDINFAEVAGRVAKEIAQQMSKYTSS